MKHKFLPVLIPLFFLAWPYPSPAADVVYSSPDEAVGFAAQNSKVWILQRQGVLQNMQAAKMSFQDFLPSFSLSLSEADSTSLLAGDSRTKTIQASVTQEIFDGGKKKLAYEANRISSLYAYQEYETAYRNFCSDIVSRYYQYLLQKEMTAIRRDLVTIAGDQLLIIRREADLGITLETDYLEYLISCINIENERDQSIRDLNALERRFKAALDLSAGVSLSIEDSFYLNPDYFYYESYMDLLWAIVKNNSTEIKKQNLAVEYARRQIDYSRRWYLPTVGAQGSISFSGDSWPLTEPKYSFKLTFDFSGMGLLPLNINTGMGFDRDRLYSVNNGVQVSARPNPAYGVQQKQADLSLLQNSLQREQTEKDLWESLYELIISHDNGLRTANAAERTITVLEQRLEFSRLELEKGEKKRIDYLDELITLARTRISLMEYQYQAAALERSLEILAGFPFGGLKNVCLQE
jgi:outer membrane protein TolC